VVDRDGGCGEQVLARPRVWEEIGGPGHLGLKNVWEWV
jgi:hypothetical protein